MADSDLDFFKSLKILAFSAVKNKDSEYMTRFLCRWFVKQGFGSLAEAEDTPLEIILQHYLEVSYENLDDEEIEKEQRLLCETAEERKEREKAEEEAAQADAAFLKKATEAAKVLGDAAKGLTAQPNDKMSYQPNVKPLKTEAPIASLPDNRSPNTPQIPPDIKMEFISENELEEDLASWDLLGPPKGIP